MKRIWLIALILCSVFLLAGLISGAEKQTRSQDDSITTIDLHQPVISVIDFDLQIVADVRAENFFNKGSPGFSLYLGKKAADNGYYFARSLAADG